MDINKILESLGVNQLDESKQKEVKEHFETLVETKADEKVKEKEQEIRDELVESYEKKFEDYKNDISQKFSDFLDEVLDEEMQIPEKVKEYARKGELYEDVLETLKSRMAIDEGHIKKEVNDLLKECRTEISKLKEEVNTLSSEKLEAKQDAKELAARVYVQEKCQGLSLQQEEKVKQLLEGVTDQEEIDKKFNAIVETSDDSSDNSQDSQDSEVNENGEGNEEGQDELNEDPFTKMKKFWVNQLEETK